LAPTRRTSRGRRRSAGCRRVLPRAARAHRLHRARDRFPRGDRLRPRDRLVPSTVYSGADPGDGVPGAGGVAVAHGAVRGARPVHPRPRGTDPALRRRPGRHEASAPRVRQPLVRDQRAASTGHSTGPGGAIERARLPEGSLLALRPARVPGTGGDRPTRDRGGSRRHRVPRGPLLG
jgi:hypothetical protein